MPAVVDDTTPTAVLLRRVRLAGTPDPRRLRDVLLTGGRVAAVDDHLPDDVASTHRAETVDADGAVLLPGLHDEHVHLAQWAATRRRIDVSAAGSPAEVARTLSTKDDGADVLLGRGFRDGLWLRPPHRHDLDAAMPGRAVVVVSQDLHTLWVSTAAAVRFGVTAPDGVVVEDEAMDLLACAGATDAATTDAWVLEATAAAAALGVTSVVDLELAPLADWARRADVHHPGGLGVPGPSLRVRAGVWPEHLDPTLTAGLRSGDPLPGVADPTARDRVRVGPLKLFVDGSLGTRTAHCTHAYPGGDHGMLRLPAAELEGWLRRATAGGLDAAVHAIGDAGVRTALDGFEAAGCGGRVEHAQQVLPADLPRFAALGVTASVQPRHAVDDRDLADHHWAGATDRAFPYRALLAAGADVVLGSDAPVAPLDPWDAVASAVHRSADDRGAWHPEQHLDLRQALRACSGGRSAVEVGDVADLVLLAEDPADVLARDGADGLRRPEVLGTLVGGRWTHRGAALG